MSKAIYLSQPVTNADFEFNSGTKRAITRKLRTNDWEIMKLTEAPAGETGRNYALIKMLMEADVILFAPDWKTNPRCVFEHNFCEHCGLPYIELG